MKKSILALSVISMLVTPITWAQDEDTDSVDTVEESTSWDAPVSGLWFYFGGDFGYSFVGSSLATEEGKHGYYFDARATASWYINEDFLLDVGGGWLFHRSTRDLTNGNELIVNTRSGFAEISPRYRFNEHWQLGPAVNVLFGTDLSFTESVGDDTAAVFAGLQGVYETGLSDTWRIRLSLRALTDINNGDSQTFLGMFGFQIGFPVINSDSTEVAYDEDEEEDVAFVEILDDKLILFDYDSANLAPRSKAFLQEFGQFLSKEVNVWDNLKIEGHADKRGGFDYNIQLSEARAQAVRDMLVQGGTPNEQTRTVGYGFTRPKDRRNTETAYEKNRRVELKFMGYADVQAINEKLDELKKKYRPNKIQ